MATATAPATDPLLEPFKALLGIAEETISTANQRNYGRTKELKSALVTVRTTADAYNAALRGRRPTKTYRWIEALHKLVEACLREMDSVQSAVDEDVLARLKAGRVRAAEFAQAVERQWEFMTPTFVLAGSSLSGGLIECEDCLTTKQMGAFGDFTKALGAIGWTPTKRSQRCPRCSAMTAPSVRT